MEKRAPAEVAADDARTKRYRQIDYFPTPPWAARAGAELLKHLYPAAVTVWEPACGEGHMAEPLREYFPQVYASDIYPHGYGAVVDFLNDPPIDLHADLIVTNPPFLLASQFVRRGLDHAARAVAVLCRLSFLEGAERWHLHYAECNLTVVAPYAERVAMQLGSWDPNLSTATAYAWFIYEPGPCFGHPKIMPIAPGAKASLTKPTDVRRFVRAKDLPMFSHSNNPPRENPQGSDTAPLGLLGGGS